MGLKHFYEDILMAVGEFGPWQFKRLLALWLIMFTCGAQYTLMEFMSFKQDEFICDPPEEANCTLNLSEDGRVIANGSTWRFANHSLVSIYEKVHKYNYHELFPVLERLHTEHPNNEGYGVGVSSPLVGLTKIQEVYMEEAYCKVRMPFRDQEGNCFWNKSSVQQESYSCKRGQGQGGDEYYHFNMAVTKSLEHEHGLICLSYWERSAINCLMSIGIIGGSVSVFLIAVKFGRRVAIATSMLILLVGAVLCLVVTHIHDLLHARPSYYGIVYAGIFFYHAGQLAIVQDSYIYLVEIVGLRKNVFSVGPFHFTLHSLIGTSFCIPFILGKIVGGALFFHSHVVSYACFFAVPLFALFFLPESPRWLIRHEYYDRAKEVLNEIAQENEEEVDISFHPIPVPRKYDLDGAEIEKSVFVTFKNPDKNDVFMEVRQYTLVQTFFGSELLPITLSFVWCWTMKGLMTILVEYQDLSKEKDFFIRRSSEVGGIVLLMFFENVLGRRRCLLNLQILTAFVLLFASIFSHSTNQRWDKNFKEIVEENCLDLLAMTNAAMGTILTWYCLLMYPASMR